MPNVGGIAGERLKSFIERIERLEEEKAALAADVREVYAEAKSTGFDVPTMREIVKLRKVPREERQEKEHLLDLYQRALGMQLGLDLKVESPPDKTRKGKGGNNGTHSDSADAQPTA